MMAKMKRFRGQIACLFTLFIILCVPASGQRSKPGGKPKTVRSIVPKKSEPLPGYEFEVKVFADGTIQLSVKSGYETRGLSNTLLEKAFSEYSEMTSGSPAKKISNPRVIIRPDPAVDMKRLMEIARSARVSGSTDLQIVTPDGIGLNIGPEPKDTNNINVKPNPLFLSVIVHKDKTVTLNNEVYGSVSDTSPLAAIMTKVFREREANGVLRPDSNEVEKTVHLTAELPAHFSDLIAVAKTISYAGAEPSFLVVDDDPSGLTVKDVKELLPVP